VLGSQNRFGAWKKRANSGAKADNFLVGDVNQLQPLAFMEAAQKAKVPVTFRTDLGLRRGSLLVEVHED